MAVTSMWTTTHRALRRRASGSDQNSCAHLAPVRSISCEGEKFRRMIVRKVVPAVLGMWRNEVLDPVAPFLIPRSFVVPPSSVRGVQSTRSRSRKAIEDLTLNEDGSASRALLANRGRVAAGVNGRSTRARTLFTGSFSAYHWAGQPSMLPSS